ncbi:hypothetical protein PHLCEN_2v9092 [Hermanssonia centrifuga]|uniref:Uncharacterized protein n=1 Tax=Hermanssonia centrifuga TaxID=98765 RepID=A0A1U7KJQ5_9APHY|nr:hypothetical protein PHLCEN_2v9092 [Hermanssonia centrifuga]
MSLTATYRIAPLIVDIARLHFHERVDSSEILRLPIPSQDALVANWGLLDILGLLLSSNEGQTVATRALAFTWKASLATVTDDVDLFLHYMRRTGACLSGGKCLSILDRAATWTAADWDFYCPHEGFDSFCLFLLHQLDGVTTHHTDWYGYDSNGNPYSTDGICERRRIRTDRATFDVMRSSSSSAFHPIAYFHSTLVMNYITADSFCIAYPNSTLVRKIGLIQSRQLRPQASSALQKYRGRGYHFYREARQFIAAPSTECLPHGYCTRTRRFFGDKHCISVTFGDTSTSTHVVGSRLTTSWVFGGVACTTACSAVLLRHHAESVLVGTSD